MLVCHVAYVRTMADIVTLIILEVLDQMTGSYEDAVAARTLDMLICWMSLFDVSPDTGDSVVDTPYLPTMLLASPEAPEVLTADLAHDMLRRLFLSFTPLNPGSHRLDLVLCQIQPVDAVHVTPLAVIVRGLVFLVILHGFLVLEVLGAVSVGAPDVELAAFHLA
jgi:hypothetical protein